MYMHPDWLVKNKTWFPRYIIAISFINQFIAKIHFLSSLTLMSNVVWSLVSGLQK